MFEIIYLFVIVLAALPLARTLMQGAGGDRIAFVHRLYRDAAYIFAAVLGIIVFESALRISLENYWFEELGQSHRYWLSLEYRVAIFFVVSLLVGLFVGANLRVLCRPYVVPTSAPWVVGFVFAALVGFFATPLWIPLMRFLGATPAGVVDPVFGKDLSFYLLALPFYDDIVEIVIGILGVTIALWVVMATLARSATAAFAYRPDPFGASYPHRNIAILSPNQTWADWASWSRQGMVLGALADNRLIMIEPVYIEAEQTKIPMLARVVLGQLLPDDRKIEWAGTLTDAERLLVGSPAPTSAAGGTPDTGTGNEMLERARALFEEMKREYASGNFARYGELLQQLGKLLQPH